MDMSHINIQDKNDSLSGFSIDDRSQSRGRKMVRQTRESQFLDYSDLGGISNSNYHLKNTAQLSIASRSNSKQKTLFKFNPGSATQSIEREEQTQQKVVQSVPSLRKAKTKVEKDQRLLDHTPPRV